MRVVYDYGMGRTGIRSGVGANIPSRDTAGEVRRETVLVISRGRADSAYDLSLSDRARAGDSGVDPTSPEYRLSDDARMRDREFVQSAMARNGLAMQSASRLFLCLLVLFLLGL